MSETKFCKHCGEKIDIYAVLCIKCGKQVEVLKNENIQPSIIINNENSNKTKINNKPIKELHLKNKWVATGLCFFLGIIGAHKFYEGKIGLGILYLFTAGLFYIGWIVDFFILLSKPETDYYV